MYKVMLADDEGIVIDSLTFMIEKNFGALFQIECAKTGRKAIELAETFRPDIVFMDIQMPGINGIEAMREMKGRNDSTVFIVLSAYDRFNYAKQAIDLGVLEYLTKPVSSSKITEVLKRAMNQIDEQRKKISDALEIKEKMKNVIPVLENGLIYSLLFQEANQEEVDNYRELLSVRETNGYVLVLEYGDETNGGILTNPVGASIRIQKIWEELRDVLKEFWNAIVGQPVSNSVVMIIPYEGPSMEYNERIQIIEQSRVMIRKLVQRFHLSFKLGIGEVQEISQLHKSYKEALAALRNGRGRVVHFSDIASSCAYEGDYPVDLEQLLFDAVAKGNAAMAANYAQQFFDWMSENLAGEDSTIRLKVLEFALWAEHIAFEGGEMSYRITDRRDYLNQIQGAETYAVLQNWFLEKVKEASRNVAEREEKQADSVVGIAKQFIEKNFARELTLEDVSREVNISPYYFSKVFKEETAENFVEYVTRVRMNHAKKLLADSSYSIKEVCAESGYSDPNYFSRIFKKNTGMTPSEYREGSAGHV